MNAAHADNIPIVYISIGSECKWQDWSIKAMYEGLCAVKCKVIWALKAPYKLPEGADKNDNFWSSAWLPQIECLAHPAMKAGVCHMGFGGTLEFISCGVPIVTWPHAED